METVGNGVLTDEPDDPKEARIMESARTFAAIGFRRWYARQLYEAYAWLTTCLLSGVVFAAIIELVGFATPGVTALVTLTILYFVGLMGVMAFRRFWLMLKRAQAYADGATCTQCCTYGAFDMTRLASRLRVRCGKCGHEWIIQQARER